MSLSTLRMREVFFDDFDSGSATGWSAVQGAPLVTGHSGGGWDISNGAGGYANPVLVHDIPEDVTILGASFWAQHSISANADWMVWHNRTTGGQISSNTYTDGHLDIAGQASPGGVIVANTWQFHEVRVRIGDTDGAVWYAIDGTTVVDVDGIDTHLSGGMDLFRTVFSTTGARTWLDDVTIYVKASGWTVGRIRHVG